MLFKESEKENRIFENKYKNLDSIPVKIHKRLNITGKFDKVII